jgi:hypothetical protein
MQRYPTRKHYNPAPAVSSSGSASAGAVNEIQKGNGAGAFAGTGFTSPADKKLVTTDVKFRFEMFPTQKHDGVTTGSDIVVAAADIADGESVSILFIWQGKHDAANQGIGGVLHSTWTKAGGAIQQVGDTQMSNVNDTGTAVNASSVNSGGSIAVQVAEVAAIFNFSYSGFVFLFFRKAA